jgi:hypothetical protein
MTRSDLYRGVILEREVVRHLGEPIIIKSGDRILRLLYYR